MALVRRVLAYKGTFAAIFIFVLALTIIGTYFWKEGYPTYTATAMIEVKSPIAPPALGPAPPLVPKDIIEQAMNTQATLIRSPGILQKALQDVDIKQTAWYRQFRTTEGENIDAAAALIDLGNRLSACLMRDSTFIQVGFSWRIPKECAQIVNVILNTYYQMIKAASQEKAVNELDQYRANADALRDQLRRQKETQERFRAAQNIPLFEQRQVTYGDKVTAYNQLLAVALEEKDQAQSFYEMYNQPGAQERMAETPEMRQQVENDAQVRYFTQAQAEARIAMGIAREKKAKELEITDLAIRVKVLDKELNDRRRQVILDTYRDMRERTRVQLDTAANKVTGIQNRLAEAKLDLAEMEKQLVIYQDRQNEIEKLSKKLEAVENGVFNLQIQKDNPELVRVNIISAIEPLEADWPRWSINLPAGIVLGLLLAMGGAYRRGRRNAFVSGTD